MKNLLLKNAKIYRGGSFEYSDLFVTDGHIVPASSVGGDAVLSAKVLENIVVLPGFCDVHVHFREPGFSYKETIKSGSMAAARGGYTAVCTMPNLKPAPDTKEHLDVQLDIIKRDAVINVYPYATITKLQAGIELSDMEELAADAIAFSDDGRGVQSEELMLEAMKCAKSLGKMIVAHCEDNSLLRGGYIHDGEYARNNGHAGICSESEWGPIKRDIELARISGCAYHVCHISTKESVALIREAKAAGVDITCETAPHYLIMNDMQLSDEGRFKMNPPIRSEEDRVALVEGILDGTIDMIATDHAPHSSDEKSKGLKGSMMGIVGIELAFPLMYTHFVKTGIITLERLVELISTNARRRFGIESDAGYSLWKLDTEYTVDPDEFLSSGRATPFAGERVFGENILTVLDGNVVYSNVK